MREILAQGKVVPIIELSRSDHAAPLAESLVEGGLRVAELTLRTECALDAIGAMKMASKDLFVGVGSIRTPSEAADAVSAGADFLVSPVATPALLDAFASVATPSLPGVATPSEALTVCDQGFDVLKLFPAESVGGVPYLRSLAGPLPHVRFCPTGGIGPDKVNDYLTLPNVVSVGGSWVATRAMIDAGEWDVIKKNANVAATHK